MKIKKRTKGREREREKRQLLNTYLLSACEREGGERGRKRWKSFGKRKKTANGAHKVLDFKR